MIEFSVQQTPKDCEIRKLIFYSTKECLFKPGIFS